MGLSEKKEELFERKYNLYANSLYRLCMVYLSNPQDSEDVLQEVFIKLLNYAPKFNDIEHERRWVFRVCSNACKNKLNYSKRHRNEELNENLIFSANENLEIASAIKNLQPIYKEVIHLYYYEGYSIKEIAGILNKGESSIKMRLVRAREILKMDLEEI